MSGLGVGALSTNQKIDPAGPPFALTSADNGLSVDPVSQRIVLGNDVLGAAGAGQLLSNREIFLNGFVIQFTSGFTPADVAAVINSTGFSVSNIATTKNTDIAPGLISIADLSGTAAMIAFAGGGPQFNVQALGGLAALGTDGSANPAIQISLGGDNVIIGSVVPAVDNGVRLQVHGHISMTTATANLDFPNTPAQTSSDLTIALADAVTGDMVVLGVDPALAALADCCWTAFVDSGGSVTVRFNNYSAGAIDPAAGNFTVSILKPL